MQFFKSYNTASKWITEVLKLAKSSAISFWVLNREENEFYFIILSLTFGLIGWAMLRLLAS